MKMYEGKQVEIMYYDSLREHQLTVVGVVVCKYLAISSIITGQRFAIDFLMLVDKNGNVFRCPVDNLYSIKVLSEN